MEPPALLSQAFNRIPVHRLAASIHVSLPQAIARMRLSFAPLAAINPRCELHLQGYATVGRSK
jgi:hypothetical protein